MIEIKDLLTRWSGLILSEELKTETIQRVLEEVVGVNIKKEDISIRNNTIYLNAKPIYKNEIYLNKEKITSALEKAFGKKAPQNLR